MIFYTKHAEDKLKRQDIKRFNINKKKINKILRTSEKKSKTKYGELAAVKPISDSHDLRIIDDIIGNDRKVITFHIARTGRY